MHGYIYSIHIKQFYIKLGLAVPRKISKPMHCCSNEPTRSMHHTIDNQALKTARSKVELRIVSRRGGRERSTSVQPAEFTSCTRGPALTSHLR